MIKPLRSGSPRNKYNGSMAQAIEKAFSSEWQSYMGDKSTAPISNDQMKHLCVAIAKGVIQHICEHPEAFEIKITIGSITYPATVIIHQE